MAQAPPLTVIFLGKTSAPIRRAGEVQDYCAAFTLKKLVAVAALAAYHQNGQPNYPIARSQD